MPNAEKMSITLTPELAAMVNDAVAAGDYASTSEGIREALRDWRVKQMVRRQQLQDIMWGFPVMRELDQARWKGGMDSRSQVPKARGHRAFHLLENTSARSRTLPALPRPRNPLDLSCREWVKERNVERPTITEQKRPGFHRFHQGQEACLAMVPRIGATPLSAPIVADG